MNRWIHRIAAASVVALVLALPAPAQMVKDARSSLDHIQFARPELRVPATHTDADLLRGRLQNEEALDAFRAAHGAEWRFTADERRGRVVLVDGGAIPLLPGHANDIPFAGFDGHCASNRCLSAAKVEAVSRQFLVENAGVLQLDPASLVLDPEGTVPVGDSIYLVRFAWTYAGIPVDRASVYLRFNGGNLIQAGTENIGPITLNPIPAFAADTAWDNLRGYMGNLWSGQEKVLDAGSLLIVPVTPAGKDPNLFKGPIGSQVDYRLTYRLVFTRPGVIGTWEVLVDAHSGEILTFHDTLKYGHVHGGAYVSDNRPPETDRPFPFADIGGGLYSDAGGNFAGNAATTTLVGKYTHIVDDCGAISNTTATGDVDFGVILTGTDCVVPSPNNGGTGNTHSARTLFYMATQINMKARTYLPTNTWLNTSFITCHVNQPAWCNATSGGGTINFYKASAPCTNLGEIPGVALHEWGHSMDDYDGSGGDSPPVETRADWTATLQTHDSCTGRGAFASLNCDGYGDACLNCTGIRDADRLAHVDTAPWTAANGQGAVYDCGGAGSYNGPCGWEDHCESGISTQALWEFAVTDLPALSGMDLPSAWTLNDRLFYAGMPTLGNMYTCTPPTSNGCGAGSLYTVFRALDDTGDGTANGTPHAAAIFASLNRHNIACGLVGDATNQNQTSCPGLAQPAVTGTPGSNSVNLSWGAITNATRYFVFRNDTDCTSGFTLVGTVTAPTVTFTDPSATNGLTSYYRVQAAAASDSCVSPMSTCVSVTPAPCAGSVLLDKSVYNCNDTVGVTMVDSNVPGDPATVTVTAWSTTDATVKTITLNKVSTANYTGSFTTTSGAAGATQVRVADGATLTVRYVDADYCGTSNVNVDATASADCAAPVITNVHSTVAGTIVHILWNTNEPANSYTMYDTANPPVANNQSGAAFITSHDLPLPALAPCSTYYYFVRSTDPAGNIATANNGGAYYTFTTGQNVMPTYEYTGAPVAIPDNATVYADITVADNKIIQDVNVIIHNITHTFDGDLDIYLVGPDNTAVELSTDNGSSGENFIETVFDDSAVDPITGGTAPFTGTFKPEGLLSALNGKNALGVWRLRVADDAGGDTGTINSWAIQFTYPAQGCGPSLEYASNTWTSTCLAGGPGAADAFIDAGEDVSITPTVTNNGTAPTTNVQATLSCSTPGVTITTGTATFPNLNAGVSSPSAAPFVIHISPAVLCGTQLDFTVHMTCAENGTGWDGYFSLVVGEVIPGGSIVVFQEDFAGVTAPALPAGWTTQTVTGNTWNTYNSYTCSAPNTLSYRYNSTQAANSWAYTPAITLQSGVTYTLNLNERIASATWPEKLSIWAGTSANNASMTLPIFAETTLTNTTCAPLAPTFTVPANGDYYIGFHCTSIADQFYLSVDDISLTFPQAAACNMNICASSTCTLTCTATATPATGTIPLNVNFTATATPTGCVETPTFAWTFGDGTTSTSQNPSHSYPAAGAYTWTLDVTADGVHCTQTGTVTASLPCLVSCTASAAPSSGNTPLTVQFTSTVTTQDCVGAPTFAWVFGDGTTSTAQNPSHTYTVTTATTFTWSLTVTVNGVTCSKTGTVAVRTYDANLFDDLGKGRVCIDTTGGRFKYTIFSGPGAGTYLGQGTVSLAGGIVTISTPATSPYAVVIKYDRNRKKGTASITIRATRVTSNISDSNTANNPPGC